jgi:hypothetical protein
MNMYLYEKRDFLAVLGQCQYFGGDDPMLLRWSLNPLYGGEHW